MTKQQRKNVVSKDPIPFDKILVYLREIFEIYDKASL
jgi:hypothetical protein